VASKFDPQLHILRSVANSVQNPKERHEAQSARHKLYQALEAGDAARARDWLDALNVALLSLDPPLDGEVMASARRAMDLILFDLGEKK
jgi:hypothetical protein